MNEADDDDPRWLSPEAPGGNAPARWDRDVPTAPDPPAPPPPPPFSPPAPPPGPPAQGGFPPPPPPAPSSYPHMPPPGYVPASNDLATAGLILGIAGVSVVVLGVGFFFFISLPCSILAWVFGAKAKRRLERGETIAGRTQAESAYVLGIIGVVLGVLGMLVWIVLIVFAASLRSINEQNALTAVASVLHALAALPG